MGCESSTLSQKGQPLRMSSERSWVDADGACTAGESIGGLDNTEYGLLAMGQVETRCKTRNEISDWCGCRRDKTEPLRGSMCICMVIIYSKVWINRVRLPIPLVVS